MAHHNCRKIFAKRHWSRHIWCSVLSNQHAAPTQTPVAQRNWVEWEEMTFAVVPSHLQKNRPIRHWVCLMTFALPRNLKVWNDHHSAHQYL
jgi:hypothetical protein